MKKIILVVFIFIFMISDVHASSYPGSIVEGEQIEGIYYYKHRNDTDEIKYEFHNFHKEATIYRRTTDNEIVYCIESWEPLSGNKPYNYEETTDYTKTKLTASQKDIINKLAYFGYGYKSGNYDHTDKKWYAITQYMIWCIQAPNIEHYFVSSISSTTPIYPFNNEIQEMNNLVFNASITPNITIPSDLFIGESYHYYDSNNILNEYLVSSSDALSTSIDNNVLNINVISNSNVKNNIILRREFKYYGNKTFEYYVSDYYQDCMSVGSLNDVVIKSQSLIRSGEIYTYLYTKNKDTKLREYLSNVKVNLHNKNTNEIIETKYTDKYGEVVFKELYKGNYYVTIEELDEYLSVDRIDTTITPTDRFKTYDVELKKQELELNIRKIVEIKELKENKYIYSYIPGINYEFGLYDEDNNLIETLTTNEEGIISKQLKIDYGKYYIKELNLKDNYISDQDKYYIDFKKKGNDLVQKINIDINNNLLKSNLTIHKVDNDNLINLSNVYFLILNEDKNLVYRDITDINGLININLPYGKYYIKEYKTLDNYILNEELYEITLDEENEYILLKNKRIIEDLLKEELLDENPEVITEHYIDIFVPRTDKNNYSLYILILMGVLLLCIKRY